MTDLKKFLLPQYNAQLLLYSHKTINYKSAPTVHSKTIFMDSFVNICVLAVFTFENRVLMLSNHFICLRQVSVFLCEGKLDFSKTGEFVLKPIYKAYHNNGTYLLQSA